MRFNEVYTLFIKIFKLVHQNVKKNIDNIKIINTFLQ